MRVQFLLDAQRKEGFVDKELIEFLATELSDWYEDGFEIALYKDQRCDYEVSYFTKDVALEILNKINEKYMSLMPKG